MGKLITRVIVLALATGSLASCGGEGEGEPLTQSSAAQVVQNLTSVLSFLPKGTGMPTLPVGSTAAIAPLFADDCETVTPDPLVDADSDGIAATKVSTFNCANFDSGGTTFTRKGKYTVTDGDDSVAGLVGGMKVVYDISDWKMRNAQGQGVDGLYKGTWEFIGGAGGAVTSTSDFQGHHAYVGFDTKSAYDYTYTWNWKMVPDNAGAPYTTGSQEINGTYSMDGDFTVEVNGVHSQFSGTWQVTYRSKDLKYDSTCGATWYRSGSLFIDDGHNNVVELRYGCTGVSYYVNGVNHDDWFK